MLEEESLILMSIKPRFGEQILAGVKKIELRRMFQPVVRGDRVILYFSSPVKALVGEFTAGEVYSGAVEEVKRLVKKMGEVGVGEEDWLYVVGARRALAIEVMEPKRYPRMVPLEVLRRRIPGFMPPMSYLRLSNGSHIGRELRRIVEELMSNAP
ncbi:MAG: ASCH domain-containing protein [Candidatus Verstraetearchaeota archaeon]|nr:ASCH domain-containing protein [Candidatus Verstraetearchaeota archaeon]